MRRVGGLVLLIGAVLVAVVALSVIRGRAARPLFVFRAHKKTGNRWDILKWLAVLPLIPAGPLLLFGLTWFVPGLLAGGMAFVAVAFLIWRVFAQQWPLARP
ncbi:MAG: hypothetical protein QOC92_2911 [Acidimicrobiaceae bacterium]|jgi:hypothetical protein